LRTEDRAGDMRASALSDLHAQMADAARGTRDQHALPRLEFAGAFKRKYCAVAAPNGRRRLAAWLMVRLGGDPRLARPNGDELRGHGRAPIGTRKHRIADRKTVSRRAPTCVTIPEKVTPGTAWRVEQTRDQRPTSLRPAGERPLARRRQSPVVDGGGMDLAENFGVLWDGLGMLDNADHIGRRPRWERIAAFRVFSGEGYVCGCSTPPKYLMN